MDLFTLIVPLSYGVVHCLGLRKREEESLFQAAKEREILILLQIPLHKGTGDLGNLSKVDSHQGITPKSKSRLEVGVNSEP